MYTYLYTYHHLVRVNAYLYQFSQSKTFAKLAESIKKIVYSGLLILIGTLSINKTTYTCKFT